MTPRLSFLDAARTGRHALGRYLLGALIILFLWLVVGGTLSATVALIATGSDSFEEMQAALLDGRGLSATQQYFVTNIPFPFFLLGIILAVRGLLRRPVRTLVTARPRIDRRRVGQGFGLWFILIGIGTFAVALVDGGLRFTLDVRAFIPFALAALVITPLQTTAEELFTRGYVMQGGSLISRRAVFLVPLSGVVFMLPHLGNPEVGRGFLWATLFYLFVGMFLAAISLRDGRLELAIGVHAANNLFGVLVVNDPAGALPAPALFTAEAAGDPLLGLGVALAAAVALWIAVFPARSRAAVPAGEYDPT